MYHAIYHGLMIFERQLMHVNLIDIIVYLYKYTLIIIVVKCCKFKNCLLNHIFASLETNSQFCTLATTHQFMISEDLT